MKLKRVFDDHGEWCYHVPSSSSEEEYQVKMHLHGFPNKENERQDGSPRG